MDHTITATTVSFPCPFRGAREVGTFCPACGEGYPSPQWRPGRISGVYTIHPERGTITVPRRVRAAIAATADPTLDQYTPAD